MASTKILIRADSGFCRGFPRPSERNDSWFHSDPLFQGTSQMNGGMGLAFGDGLRCASGAIVRLKTVTNAGGASRFPQAGDPSVSLRGMVSAPGTRTNQVWYRNAAAFCTPNTFNLTNGIEVDWNS